ncbi:MOSC domain-containing protein [Nocardioides bizhenqiangii]|uniref:MOSC domain-containing protein n=1 Tax=Nocardioides bizhenqiangii TaxID=3095076 RepID=A0ABZ0ZWS4_9ACTN|nr:MOSC domain-containing protein [Nocardioides sp. HM61]WQQ28191.1 MOSC domain-containing protein [Nocardioides sp. HM61]
MPRLLSVNVGLPKEADWAGIGRTSIDKQPVTGQVAVTELGVAGDQVSDTVHHGGIDQAVSAYAREDLDFWAAELGRDIRAGQFGENLTTEGVDLTHVAVGTRLQVGEVLLEIASVRTPCNDFKNWMGLSGFDNTAWVKRFAAEGRPGPYLRVLATGSITAGDSVEIVHEPDHGVTVRDMFVALFLDRSRLPDLLAIEDLAPEVRRKVEQYLSR